MEPIHVISKEEFRERLEAMLATVTHVGIFIERTHGYATDGKNQNGFGLVALGVDPVSMNHVFQITADICQPAREPKVFCNDPDFMNRVAEQTAKNREEAARQEQRNRDEHQRREARTAEIGQILNSPLTTEHAKSEAALELIAEAISQHES